LLNTEYKDVKFSDPQVVNHEHKNSQVQNCELDDEIDDETMNHVEYVPR